MHIHTHTHIQTHTYTRTQTHTYTNIHTNTYTHTHTNTQKHTDTHTHMHYSHNNHLYNLRYCFKVLKSLNSHIYNAYFFKHIFIIIQYVMLTRKHKCKKRNKSEQNLKYFTYMHLPSELSVRTADMRTRNSCRKASRFERKHAIL